ncbi:MAG: hypothetical protein ACMVO5_00415 [Polymorphobacter sp.]|uniref:hypothetical protein n=1 Tax=Polymorphobacter sp. TaxID=1909290 RepID=UPI003A881233
MTDSKTPKTSEAAPEQISDEALDAISGGPNRRPHDHIGNFNLKGPTRPTTQVVTVADGSPTV